jgi:hypothetical protein
VVKRVQKNLRENKTPTANKPRKSPPSQNPSIAHCAPRVEPTNTKQKFP